MSTEASNKEIVKKAQEVLKGLGHDVSLGHCYEMFSKLVGLNSYNVAKAQGAAFIETLKVVDVLAGPPNEGKNLYRAKVRLKPGSRTEFELTKHYIIQATDAFVATSIAETYVKLRQHSSDAEEIQKELDDLDTWMENLLAEEVRRGVRNLFEIESEDDFKTKNWAVTYYDDFNTTLNVEDVYKEL